MWNPATECFSVELFRKHVNLYSRGVIPQRGLISDFLQSFDPDALLTCLGLLDDGARGRLYQIVESSPQTEQEWVDLRLAHRIEAEALFASLDYKLPLGHGDRVFIVDLDWAWHSDDASLALRRYEVYALRQAFRLPTHECDWSEWCVHNSQQIAETGLNPWIFENRTRWYAYLGGGTIPWSRYEHCPRTDDLLLNAEQCGTNPTVLNLLARLRLIEDNYPNYFFNIRRRLTEQLHSAWNIKPYR